MLSYDYTSGQIKRDFVLKKVWGDCDVNPESNTTIGVFCKGCPITRDGRDSMRHQMIID